MSDASFERLHPAIQQALYRMQWESLRPIQQQSVEAVYEGDEDLLITAQTAGGKTEAAFLPVLSRILEEPKPGIRALYLGPLKALINDQFRRVEGLCEDAKVPVWRWHGDVPATQKTKLIEDPSGVLLITPESLESLFVNRSEHLNALFAGLDFVVIDEYHVFLGSDRGAHMFSLLSRLRKRCPLMRVVALSATIGEMDDARRALRGEDFEQVRWLRDEAEAKEIRLKVHGFDEEIEERVAHDLFHATTGRSALVFANRRADVESYADRVRELYALEKLPDRVLVHHGSLARALREDAEARMKNEAGLTIFCTSTLELGIDIGNVEMTAHIGAPPSVAGFVQQIGRSGRRDGEVRICRSFLACEKKDEPHPVHDFAPRLLQTIAVIELMREGWLEAPQLDALDYSTLTQQVLSVIRETGGVQAAELYATLCADGAFRHITSTQFANLLRALAERDIVEQAPDDTIILGMEGETLANRFDFYAAFQAQSQFDVLHEGKVLGKLPVAGVPEPEEHLILNGRRWVVLHVNQSKKRMVVAPATGRKRPMFLGGTREMDARIRDKMRETLLGKESLPYLDTAAQRILQSAREEALDYGLTTVDVVEDGRDHCLWYTWTGTREQKTLIAMLRQLGVEFSDQQIMIRLEVPRDECKQLFERMLETEFDPLDLASSMAPLERRKYDELLTPELLVESMAHDVVRIEAARAVIQRARL